MVSPEIQGEKIKIGISLCLLGEKVRFDGGHKRDAFIVETLSGFFDWVPVCPEVEIGLGTPRESLRLAGDPDAPRMVTTKTGVDHTDKMTSYGRRKARDPGVLGLDGFILKKNSPSCGLYRVRVYQDSGMPLRSGTGLFARQLQAANPLLPVEEEGRLNDMRLRENFIVRVFCHHRWRTFVAARPRLQDLVKFHTANKFLLMAHSEKHMRDLGRLVANAKHVPMQATLARFAELYFSAFQFKATRRKHTNVLMHILGFFKKHLDAHDKQELLQIIEDYRLGFVPLVAPLTLIRHYVSKFDLHYIRDQIYLNPHPKELMLLNHV